MQGRLGVVVVSTEICWSGSESLVAPLDAMCVSVLCACSLHAPLKKGSKSYFLKVVIPPATEVTTHFVILTVLTVSNCKGIE